MQFKILLSTAVLATLAASIPTDNTPPTRGLEARGGEYVGNAMQYLQGADSRNGPFFHAFIHTGDCQNIKEKEGHPATHIDWHSTYNCRFYRDTGCNNHIGGPEGDGVKGRKGASDRIGDQSDGNAYRAVKCW
ncbi:hypothetical protein BDV95DRAFT_596763 [Massariosphaeria phaeospora]|uniref:Prokaryotic phospholipase A2-domain-containing protein n=1 Tax=Massariosphaeria phaeospora TaxID=100035 RepID=A0A7C8M5D8_9PLEO|nr:hypothetical protein BDV95DRAFT_596763 [Massariosphaeria phaeospora]